MALNRIKAFTVKNGEFPGSIVAYQSGYSGGMPARVNADGEIARAYSDTGYAGLYAKGSDVDKSGNPVTFYNGPGIFTMEKGAGEAAYPYDEDLTYVPGNPFGNLNGEWVNAGYSILRGTVLGVGTISGGKTTNLTLMFL